MTLSITDAPTSSARGDSDATAAPLTRQSLAVDGLIGAAIGLVMAIAIFDFSFFFSDSPLVGAMQGDAGSSFAGFRYFIEDSWHFPLLETQQLTNPAGEPTVIAFTDSLPLLALTARALSFLGLSADTWIGVWYYGCLVAQGATAAIAVRMLGARSRWTIAAAAAWAVAAPVLIMRVWHPGLFGHFTILTTWIFVGAFWRAPSVRRAAWAGPVQLLSLLVHPYFLLMNSIVITGVVGAAIIDRRITIRAGVAWAAGTGAFLLAAMVTLGYLPNDAASPGGYGSFGMHVVSPIWPQWSTLWPGNEWILSNANNSFEGINYLGAGGVLALAVAVFSSRGAIADFVVRRQVVVLTLLGLTAMAITPTIYLWNNEPVTPFGEDAIHDFCAGNRDVQLGAAMAILSGAVLFWGRRSARAKLAAPGAVATGVVGLGLFAVSLVGGTALCSAIIQYRATGRLFWIIGYGLALASLILLERLVVRRTDSPLARAKVLPAVMAAIVLIQLADTNQFRNFVPDMLAASEQRQDELASVIGIMEAHDEIRIAPAWNCASTPEALSALQDAVISSSQAQRRINGFYGGRTDTEAPCALSVDTQSEGAAILAVVIPPLDVNRLGTVPATFGCRATAGEALLCSDDWSRVPPELLALHPEVPVAR